MRFPWFLLAIPVIAAVLFAAHRAKATPDAIRRMDPPPATRPAALSPGPVTMLPKWRVAPDVVVVPHADGYTDYRAAHPRLYAVTQPPAGEGFGMAPEWAAMSSMMLANPGGLPAAVQQSMIDMIRASIDAIEFDVVVGSETVRANMLSALRGAGVTESLLTSRMRFLVYPSDSLWMADFGPFALVRGGTMAFADFRYYPDRVTDDAFPTALGDFWGATTYRAPLDFEGGNLATDGEGTCYVSQTLYWANADKAVARVDELMGQYLGCRQMVVLEPLEDGTGHIDMFSKLVSKNVIVLGQATTADATPETVATLERNAAILEAVVLGDGSRLAVHRIPMPYQRDGVWRTYTNATFANGVNLVPTYAAHAAHQAEAMAAWAAAMPGWVHVPVESGEIITWGGAMHCISRTLPVATPTAWIPDGTCVEGTCGGVEGGYAGPCDTDGDCTGPALVCDFNDCDIGTPCGELTYEGCCAGDRVRYCEEGRVQVVACEDGCGWSDNGYYDCGGSGPDPGGAHPIECPDTCVPACAARACGDDGCGGSCGTCGSGATCLDGACVPDPVEPAPDAVDPLDAMEVPDVVESPDADPVADAACVPACGGGWCGDDGCGGRCPGCPDGWVCGDAGFCMRHAAVDAGANEAGPGDGGEDDPGAVAKGAAGCAASSRAGGGERQIPGILVWILAAILLNCHARIRARMPVKAGAHGNEADRGRGPPRGGGAFGAPISL